MSTPTMEARRYISEAGWQLDAKDRQTFAGLFSEYLQAAGLSRSDMARLLTESPFNTDGSGKLLTSRKSNERKVARWANGEQVTRDRSLLFQVCILLGLDTTRARAFFEKGLQMGWIYAASREELIYGFCIACRLDITVAHELICEPQQTGENALLADGEEAVGEKATQSIYNDFVEFLPRLPDAMPRETKLAHFRAFLDAHASDFHLCSRSRREAFMELYTPYMKETLTREAVTAYGKIEQVTYTRSIIEMADDLRLMALPHPELMEELDREEPDAEALAALRKMLDDDKLGDPNPIRKDLANYVSGKKEVPRDVLIKTYILVNEGRSTDLFDLDDLLIRAGYPPVYVRSASGLDALAYDLLHEPSDESTAYADFCMAVVGERDYAARKLGVTDRLQAAARARADQRAAAEQEVRELREVQEADQKKGRNKGFFQFWRK
ncbi:MAG: hypothetical protein IJF79_05510 [Clostridia bacterium]|nr:hypothetical protein [Clostridia bacterium]